MAKGERKKTGAAVPAEEEKPQEPQSVRTTVTHGDDCRCTLEIEADADYLQKDYEERLSSLQSRISLPGFRRGKAPRALVERKVAEPVKSEMLASVLQDAYEKAVRDGDLQVVAELEPHDIESMEWEPGQPAKFKVVCEVLPKLELDKKDYEGLDVEVPALEVDSDMVQEQMDRFAARFGSVEKVEGAGIDIKDRVVCDLSVAREGQGEPWVKEVDFSPGGERVGPFVVEGLKGSVLGAKTGDVRKLTGTCTEREAAPEGLEHLAGRQVPIESRI